MKKYYFFPIYYLLLFKICAQQMTSGKITFKETIKFNIDMGGDNPELAKMIPPSQSIDKIMYFNSHESLFKNLDKAKDVEVKHEEDGNDFQLVLQMPESITYMSKSDDSYLQTQNLMGKDFLIKDKMPKYNWKLTNEQKKIMNFVCQKAVLIDSAKKLVVWFTPQIPVSIGPNALNGLPGMILALEQDNGERTVIATSIEELPDNFTFEKPTKGKQVSKVEFEKIREDKMKEMGAINGGGGTGVKMIIREERN